MPEIFFPDTPEGWCVYYKALDIKFGTDKDSPLHHDFRCPIHGTHPKKDY